MKPLFCGNLDYDVRQPEVERLFRKYGRVERIDMKSGFAFVYMEDERDAEDAIRRLDRIEFGRKGRRLRVEWTKHERDSKRAPAARSSGNTKPSKTLFVINFDPIYTRSRDLERHFEPYGKIVNIRIRRNFAFIQFESDEEAAKALDATNMSKLMDRVITVEFAIRDDDDRRNGHSPDRRGGRDASPRRGYDRRRSPSPYGRERGSPDYGYGRQRESPDYGHGPRGRSKPDARGSLSPGYARDESPANGGRYHSRSPLPRERSRSPALRDRSRSLRDRSPPRGRSPPPRERSRSLRDRSPPPHEGSRSLRDRSPPARDRPPPSRYMSRSPPPRDISRSPPPRDLSRSPPPRDPSRSPPPRDPSRSPLPRDLSRSPPPRDLSRSPPPRDLSRSPRGRSLSPHGRSPSPRGRSRS